MNGEAPVQPVEQLMTRALGDVESLVRRDPGKAMLAALGLGLALHAVPTRFIVASVTAVSVTVLRPALLTLGVVKAFELYTSHQSSRTL